jgi:hypothetical protein
MQNVCAHTCAGRAKPAPPSQLVTAGDAVAVCQRATSVQQLCRYAGGVFVSSTACAVWTAGTPAQTSTYRVGDSWQSAAAGVGVPVTDSFHQPGGCHSCPV